MQDKVAIIGGGIGGLAAALALLKRGIDVEIYEQAAELKEVGAGIQISSNGTRVLYALGLEEALKRVQVLPARRAIRHWSSGETWNWFDLGAVTAQRYGTPHVMLHRGDLHGLLAEAVKAIKPDAVKLGRCCAAATTAGNSAAVRFDDGGTVQAAYAIGADGIHSKVRAALFGADKPTFTGAVAWRGLVPMADLRGDAERPGGLLEDPVHAGRRQPRLLERRPRADHDYRSFVTRNIPEAAREGVFVDEQGQVLGRHAGIHRFTVGQRKGLGLAAPTTAPMYVLALRPADQQVVVGPKAALERTVLTASGVNWIVPEPAGPRRVAAQIRHRHEAAPATVRALGDARAEVVFDAPQLAISPGQAVVFYDGDAVVGGGWID